MFHRAFLRFSVAFASFGLLASSIALRAQDDNERHGRKYKAPPLASHIEITVLKAYNGKPIENAHVIFHPIEGDRDKGSLELKTNEDGKIVIDVIPIGDTVRLQVIAAGYQTYGHDYKIDKPEITMEVRMNRPGSQYSIYNKNSGSANNSRSGNGSEKSGGSGNNSDKSANPSQDAAPPPSDKPSGSGSKPDSQQNGNQSQPQPK